MIWYNNRREIYMNINIQEHMYSYLFKLIRFFVYPSIFGETKYNMYI